MKEMTEFEKSELKHFLNGNKNFTVTAHTGAFGTEQNSLESVKAAIASKVDILEVDVTFRPDTTPVIKHDAAPTAGEGILLEEVFKLLSECKDKRINLDLKSFREDCLPSVEKLANDYKLIGRAFFTGVSEKDCATVARCCPNIPYYLNCSLSSKSEEAVLALASKTVSLGAIGINMYFKKTYPDLYQMMNDKNILVSLWTVNTIKSIRKVLEYRTDNITTKDPQKVFEVIGR